MKKNIAIIGASIAGLSCALTLTELGFNVTIYEKSSNDPIPDRGAGIWLPPSLIKHLIKKNFLPKNFSYLSISERPIYLYDQKNQKEILLTSHSIDSAAVHWLELYEGLKAKCTKANVIYNTEITALNTDKEESVELTLNDSFSAQYDFCIFADGGHSIGRQHLFPEHKPTFTNTIIWRGTLDKINEETTAKLLGKGLFYVCERGHLLIYPVPNQSSSDTPTAYKINWLFYEFTDPAHELFQENKEKASQNVAKGKMSTDYLAYLHRLATTYLPAFPRQIILDTDQPFIQAMHEVLVPSYIGNRVCLIGDASTTLRAHAAAGATKAIQDGLVLGESLIAHNNDMLLALKDWNNQRYKFGKSQFELGRELGKFFVTHVPDWKKISKEELDKKWYALTHNICWYANDDLTIDCSSQLFNNSQPNTVLKETIDSSLASNTAQI